VKRIPREAQPRLKGLVARLIDSTDLSSNSSERAGYRIKNDESVVTLGRHHAPVVTQAHLDRQVRCALVVILHKEADRTLCNAAGLIPRVTLKELALPSTKAATVGKLNAPVPFLKMLFKNCRYSPPAFMECRPHRTAHGVRGNKHRVSATRRVVRRPAKTETARNSDLWKPDRFINPIKNAEVCRLTCTVGVSTAKMRLKPNRASLTTAGPNVWRLVQRKELPS
jgi:hypothetical protein